MLPSKAYPKEHDRGRHISNLLNFKYTNLHYQVPNSSPKKSKYLKAPSPSVQVKKKWKNKKDDTFTFSCIGHGHLPCNYFTQQIKKRSVVNQQLLETKDKDEFAANEDSCPQALPWKRGKNTYCLAVHIIFYFFISCLKIKSTSKLVVEGKLSKQQLDLKFESPKPSKHMDLVNTGLQPALCDHELPFKQPPMALHPLLLCQVRSPRRQGYTKAFQGTEKCSRCRKYLEAKGES